MFASNGKSLEGKTGAEPVSVRKPSPGEEFCNCCGKGMDFSIRAHIDDPIRFEGGAYYREGAGQTCVQCEATVPKS